MITSVPQHDIFLVYPVLALLREDALIWLPHSDMSHVLNDSKFCKSLKAEIRSAPPSYDAYSARISGLTIKRHFQSATRSSSMSSSAPSTPSDARPRRESDDFAIISAGRSLAEDIEQLSEVMGQTHLEAATYLNWASYDQPLPHGGRRDPLSHVRLRMRRVTETAYGLLTSKVYELDLCDWRQARDIAASHNHASWWDCMDRQIWRSSLGVFVEVTRRFAHQGIYEPSPIWHPSKWHPAPARFLPVIEDPMELQKDYGVVGRLQDPKNAKMKLYIENKSRDCRPEARQRDRILLPLLRTAASSADVDGNWTSAFSYVGTALDRLERQQEKVIRADDGLSVLAPYIEKWLLSIEQIVRQQRALQSCVNGHALDGFLTGNEDADYYELVNRLERVRVQGAQSDSSDAAESTITVGGRDGDDAPGEMWPLSD